MIKKTITILLFLAIQLSANQAFSQMIKCDYAAGSKEEIKKANPKVCIDAANLYKQKNNLTSKEKQYMGSAYYNAGLIYQFGEKHKSLKKAFKMYMNSYYAGNDDSDLFNIIGVLYNNGYGTKKNKIKAYEFYRESAKRGNEYAQKNLEILCKESPWACK